jgi:AraC-like DNA-binding protein
MMPVDDTIQEDPGETTRPSVTLPRHHVLRTTLLDEAREVVAGLYLDHTLSAPGDRLAMTLNSASNQRFTLGYLTYRTEATLVMPPTEDSYLTNITLTGETSASRADGGRERTQARRRGVVLRPDQQNTVRWSSDATQLILKIPRQGLERHLGSLLGRRVDGVVDFDFGLDLQSPAGSVFLSSVEFLARELDRPGGLAAMPLAREQYEAFVMTQLLYAGRHRYTDELVAPADPVRRGRLRPVLDYIEQHAHEPLTPQDLARIGIMSVRTLHSSFQQNVGESPMTYLRGIRLDRARTELLHGDPQVTRVTEVALRWGFAHQSRFAQAYRERFSELPSDTLRRS